MKINMSFMTPGSTDSGSNKRVRRDLGMLRMGKRLPSYYDIDSLVDGDDVSFESDPFGRGHGYSWLKLQRDYSSWPFTRSVGKRSSFVEDESDTDYDVERMAFYDRLHDLLVAQHQTLGRKKREIDTATEAHSTAADSNKTDNGQAIVKERPSPSSASARGIQKRSLHPRLGFYRAPSPSPFRASNRYPSDRSSQPRMYDRAPLPRLGLGDDDKRSMSMLRMGKRVNERSMSMMRMGRRSGDNGDDEDDFDKRSMSMLRMGRSGNHDDDVDDESKRSMSMLRMG